MLSARRLIDWGARHSDAADAATATSRSSSKTVELRSPFSGAAHPLVGVRSHARPPALGDQLLRLVVLQVDVLLGPRAPQVARYPKRLRRSHAATTAPARPDPTDPRRCAKIGGSSGHVSRFVCRAAGTRKTVPPTRRLTAHFSPTPTSYILRVNARRRRIAKHRRRDRRDRARWGRECLFYDEPMFGFEMIHDETDDDYGLFFITFGEPAP